MANPSEKTFETVANTIRDRIISGRYPLGSKLPTGKELAAEFGVVTNTVLRARSELGREGYVTSQQGRASYVCDVLPDRDSQDRDFDRLSGRLDELGSLLLELAQRVAELEALELGRAGD